MKREIDFFLTRWLAGWVDWVGARARGILACILGLTAILAVYTFLELGINADNVSLMPTNLPSRLAHEAFIRQFPNLEEAIFVVVEADTPELARKAAIDLTERLQEKSEFIQQAYLPGGGEFFERNGLLYRSPEELDDFADKMAEIQPLLTQLEQDPTLGNMTRILQDGLDELNESADDGADWALILDRLSEATLNAWDDYPIAVSWEELLLRDSSLDISRQRVIVVHPILDYSDILMGRRPIHSIREAAQELNLDTERGVRVRITGNPALNYDEMIGIAWDVGAAGVFCFILVALVLLRAVRSPRIVAATLLTLLVGLIWTAAFTAAAIGTLNPLSITFAILFIGLGADFGIHLGMAYVDLLPRRKDHAAAMRESAGKVGSALVFCTLTTAIGFFVFVPTDYLGVAELGLISGTGMFVILFLTLTLFPALLSTWLRVDPAQIEQARVRFTTRFWLRIGAYPRTIRAVSALMGLLALMLLPGLRFDANVIEMRDPESESVQAFRELLANSSTSPWYLNVLMPDLDSAVQLAAEIESLEEVDHVISLASFVPEEQDEKIEILQDVAFLLEQPEFPRYGQPTPRLEEQIESLEALHDYLASNPPLEGDAPLARSVIRLREHLAAFLSRIESDSDPARALSDLEAVLLGPFPAHLKRVREALDAQLISLENLPARLSERMLAADGTARLQVYPVSELGDGEAMEAFVFAVKEASPNAAGVPLNLVEFANVISFSFTTALTSAFITISLLLLLLWRSLRNVLLVLAPLCLGGALTAATAALLDIRLNFINIVVIPLIFGIGVDSAIHLVQKAKEDLDEEGGLLGTSTARAVYYSAATTAVSFGSLALASHNGLHSLGVMLCFGLAYTLISVLILLPALLSLHPSKKTAAEPDQ